MPNWLAESVPADASLRGDPDVRFGKVRVRARRSNACGRPLGFRASLAPVRRHILRGGARLRAADSDLDAQYAELLDGAPLVLRRRPRAPLRAALRERSVAAPAPVRRRDASRRRPAARALRAATQAVRVRVARARVAAAAARAPSLLFLTLRVRLDFDVSFDMYFAAASRLQRSGPLSCASRVARTRRPPHLSHFDPRASADVHWRRGSRALLALYCTRTRVSLPDAYEYRTGHSFQYICANDCLCCYSMLIKFI